MLDDGWRCAAPSTWWSGTARGRAAGHRPQDRQAARRRQGRGAGGPAASCSSPSSTPCARRTSGRPGARRPLFYCTRRGDFQTVDVPVDERGTDALDVVLDTIDGAVAQGALPAAPKDGACRWCDYRQICGPSRGAPHGAQAGRSARSAAPREGSAVTDTAPKTLRSKTRPRRESGCVRRSTRA